MTWQLYTALSSVDANRVKTKSALLALSMIFPFFLHWYDIDINSRVAGALIVQVSVYLRRTTGVPLGVTEAEIEGPIV